MYVNTSMCFCLYVLKIASKITMLENELEETESRAESAEE